jgi:anti-anti-sigma factor
MEPDSAGVGSPEAALAAFRASPAPALVAEGPDLCIVALNDAARRFAGRRPLLGRPWGEAIPEARASGLLAMAERVYRLGKPFGADEWRVELDGHAGPDDYFVNLRLAPWRGPDGSVRGVIGEAVDVTDEVAGRLDAEARRREANRRYDELRDLSQALQDTLLPDGLPVLPGLQTAGSYLLAQEEFAAGGDWLDVVPRGNGRAALVVGDVVGHGVEASAVMGQLRAVCEERLSTGDDIASVLRSLDRYAERQPAAHAATVAIVDLDPATGELSYCTAGHPPPLVLHDRESRFLAPTGSGPLGTASRFRVETDVLAEDELLLLYTDGIIERPGRRPTQATIELAQTASRAADTVGTDDQPAVDRVCRQTMELLTRDTGYSDDITLLVGRRVPRVRELQFETQASVDTLREVRTRLAGWFSVLRPATLDQMALQHAIGEAVTNVVEHAYSPEQPDRPVCVSLSLDGDGRAVARIEDHGRWRPKANRGTGSRGLPMVNGLMDEMHIDRGDDHTTVTLRHRLSRSLSMMKGVSTRPPADGWADYESLVDDDVLRVRGVVDLTTADRLGRDLMAFTIDATGPAVVDLSGVDLLASAGVQVLYDARQQARRQGVELRLRAGQGSVAQHVLHLVGMEIDAEGSEVPDEALPPL